MTMLYFLKVWRLHCQIIQKLKPLIVSMMFLRVVILSGYDLPVYRSEGRKIGAKGFVNKNIEPEKLISILSKIMQGILYFDKEIPFIEGLTDSEKQIIQLIAEGQKRKDIAVIL